MGFLKKKQSIRLPNGPTDELVQTASPKSNAYSTIASPPTSPTSKILAAMIAEARHDEETTFASDSSGAKDKEAREKPVQKKKPLSSVKSPSKPRRKPSSSSGGTAAGASKKPTISTASATAAKTRTKTRSGYRRKHRDDPSSTTKLPDTDKSKVVRRQQRGRRTRSTSVKRGRNSPTKIKNSESSSTNRADATPRVSNGKTRPSSRKPGHSKKRLESRSRSESRSVSSSKSRRRRPIAGRTGRALRGASRAYMFKRRSKNYETSDDESYGSSSSGSDSSSYSESDDYRTGLEDSTMYATDASGSIVSIGYNTSDSDAMTNGASDGTSGEDTDTDADFTGDEGLGVEVSPRSFRSHTTGCTNSFSSDHSGKVNAGSEARVKKSTAIKTAGTSYKEAQSAHGDFLNKMEDFVAKDEEHQMVVMVKEHGNVERLSLQESSYIPEPNKSNEIVIKVDCSTISLQDCMIRRGKWYEMQKLPFIPGSDLVGTIYKMSKEASTNSAFQVGDKVAAVVPTGGNAKYISIECQNVIRVPNEIDSAVALCLSSTYVPARQALDLARKLNTPFTGANILIIGGNGPSGLAAIELAMLEGANVFTTADGRHHEYLTSLGARCFPIDPSKWLPTLQGKIDVVLDSVCLDGYDSSSLALNPTGTLVCTGMSAIYTQGQMRSFGIKDARDYKAMYCKMRARYVIKNSLYYDRTERYGLAQKEYAQHFRYLCHLASKNTITPLVSCRATLNSVASAQKAIELGDAAYGVCLCLPWGTQTDQITDPVVTAPDQTESEPSN